MRTLLTITILFGSVAMADQKADKATIDKCNVDLAALNKRYMKTGEDFMPLHIKCRDLTEAFDKKYYPQAYSFDWGKVR